MKETRGKKRRKEITEVREAIQIRKKERKKERIDEGN